MTPEQRAAMVDWLRSPFDLDTDDANAIADLIHDDGVTIATLTAECDALQAAIDSAEISGSITTEGNLWRFWARMAKDSAAKTKEAQAEIARLTAALATAREESDNPRPVKTAPKDGSMLRLLVDYEGVENLMPLTDDNQSWTIGFNTLEDTGDDEWIIAGWNWSQDCFGTGEGKVIGWLPFATIQKGAAT